MANNTQQAKVISPEGLKHFRYPVPDSMIKVVGLLKGKKRVDPLGYQKKIRKEWNNRLAKLERLITKSRRFSS